MDGGFAIAQDWNTNYTLMTSDAPAQAGDIAVLYATGLGLYEPAMALRRSGAIRGLDHISGQPAIAAERRRHRSQPGSDAGVTPGYCGLYQISFTIPADAGTNPEIRVQIGTQVSISSIKLAVE